jgi:hypothetical protein
MLSAPRTPPTRRSKLLILSAPAATVSACFTWVGPSRRAVDIHFAAQRFGIRNGDVLYVANSQLSDLQRFVNILASSVLPVAPVRNTVH